MRTVTKVGCDRETGPRILWRCMNLKKPLLTCLVAVHTIASVAQGTFQNLGFEQASVATIPSGGFGSLEPISATLPFWIGYLGNTPQTVALHNNYSLGAPALGILGPVWSRAPVIIEGNYTAILQAGSESPGNNLSASIAQTGLIPDYARSLRVKVETFLTTDLGQLEVTIGGQAITLVPLVTQSGYTVLGGEITPFAGLSRELRLSALPIPADPFSSFAIDSIVFSEQPIPEPSTFGLFGLGA